MSERGRDDRAGTAVGPHEFSPLGRFRHRDKCRHCYCTRDLHPTTAYEPARPYGDKGHFPRRPR